MARKDEEKMAFHMDEGVFCYTKMTFGLKNAKATYQKLVDTIFEGQMGRNLEAYMDDMVIKRKFLGYMVTSKGIRANPEKTKAVMDMPSPSSLKQMQRLSEIDYPSMEKLDLALVYAARRLRRYNGRGQPDIYKSGRTRRNFKGKVQEVRRTTEDQMPIALPDKTSIWKLYTDGALNDHGSGACLILIDPEGLEYSNAI
uniref:Reverse transcriptase domain-containing protein n=1 Tax=Tanacetum cinerariifolium TaxID=118510 RepID=A0A6L2N827_TANCI|nr:hypothetical protein [Tanacetum cinerariifolium]